MIASDIIAQSHVCRKAASNIDPENPDELFQTVWLKIREREIANPGWQPDDPKRYFLKALKFERLGQLRNKTRLVELTEDHTRQGEEPPEQDISCPAFLFEWMEECEKDNNSRFLSNITTLAMYSNKAVKLSGLSRNQFYHYFRLAKQKIYDDYYGTDTYDHYHIDLV